MGAVLELQGGHAGYGKAKVLEGVSVRVDRSAVVGLVGRNGAGKTTLLSALMGLLDLDAERYDFDGADALGLAPYQMCRRGLSLVPADRQVFGELSVLDNLRLARYSGRSGAWNLARAYELFPRLHERRNSLAVNLSGGEKQMLVIARGVLANPLILMLDEPTEGLAPIVVQTVAQAIGHISADGVAVLIVEQNLHAIQKMLTHAYVLEDGRLAWSGTDRDLIEQETEVRKFLTL